VTRRLQLNTDGVRLRTAPNTSSVILVENLGIGTVVTALDDYDWRKVRTPGGTVGWVAARYLSPTPQDGPGDDLSMEPEHRFTFGELRPHIHALADEHGADPQVVAGVIFQESGFRNYRVHLDGTGHGLVGLDDNGLLPDFERWSGLTVGRGAAAEIIPPGLQIAYLAKTIKDYSYRVGSHYNAARAWHRGEGRGWDHLGARYEELIRSHVAALYG
jgi:hypothetical protein